MKKVFVSVVGVIVIGLCFFLSGCAAQQEPQANQTTKYTMYIGLNDKDKYTQLISYEEAEKEVSDIALKYVDGFTELYAKGAYKDDKGILVHENSLVFEFYSVTDQQMKAIMDEVLKKLNQKSILIEKQTVNDEFYEGVKQ
ncbi:hypothetical protein Desor_3775 [Desulfosporosinus orientis DSM 765]|uniref:DUF3574 domain-containing protein n=1 Tax=Desulfosporosinus orientis (strain ATCC 19365 / DSM 765 / NCIMB 8382 / VKM B-1628 / Singapore I) TaxID=768706 RepID=G7W6V5_DESOD|nr:hypothetical protein Desor_3775 [Desulfosporosinus orientis DSM 765]